MCSAQGTISEKHSRDDHTMTRQPLLLVLAADHRARNGNKTRASVRLTVTAR